ncbi:MAG TPA: carbohydrate binding family 9 domain-containing protein, partial [Vicinamibacteria bacterium]|nr:carbohydrate binding family 9 domain-containing protein [Vicinamibacteria bacterium]
MAGVLALAPPATAQPVPRKQARAVRVPADAIRVDGRLDEDAWRQIRPLTDFVQKEPVEGAPPTDRMEVFLAYDEDALLVGARMWSRPGSIQAPVTRRDDVSQAEHLWIALDTYLDRRTAYGFGVTASGVRLDHFHPIDNEYEMDATFDPVWEAAAHRLEDGWSCELRIPYSQLRFNAAPEQVWGLNIDRWIPSRFEDVFWVPVPKKVTAWA